MPLKDFVTAYWKFDGTFKDEIGTADLTAETATVDFTDGVRGAAVSLDRAQGDHLRVPDRASLSMGDIDFYLFGWFKLRAVPSTNNVVMAKGGLTQTNFLQYAVTVDDGPPANLRFYVGNGAAIQNFQAAAFGTILPNVWHFFEAWHNATTNQVGVAVNRTENVYAYAAGCHDGVDSLEVGDDGGNGRFLDGWIDELGVCKGYIPTATERDALYNGGEGLQYPFVEPVADLDHDVDDIIAKLLWGTLRVGADPSPWAAFAFNRGTRPTTEWPVFSGGEPHEPMNCITVVETAPQLHAVIHVTGEQQQHYGFTVRVRAGGPTAKTLARQKADQISLALTQVVKDADVLLDGEVYRVVSVPRAQVVRVGPGQTPQGTSGYVWNVNCLAPIMKHPIPGQT